MQVLNHLKLMCELRAVILVRIWCWLLSDSLFGVVCVMLSLGLSEVAVNNAYVNCDLVEMH